MSRSTFGGRCASASLPWFCPPPIFLCRSRRSFVTGCWGCGVFCGDVELKFMIPWLCCSLEPSLKQMIFCPFSNQAELDRNGCLDKLVGKLTWKVQVKLVLDSFWDPAYRESYSTLEYLFDKLD